MTGVSHRKTHFLSLGYVELLLCLPRARAVKQEVRLSPPGALKFNRLKIQTRPDSQPLEVTVLVAARAIMSRL